MPFCSHCGRFAVLNDQKLCRACEELLYEGKISEERFRNQQSRLHDDVSMSLLHYRTDGEFRQTQPDLPHTSEEPFLRNQEISTSQQRHDEQEDGIFFR